MVANTDVLVDLIADDRRYIESLMLIHDKQRNLVPFNLNAVQARFLAEMTFRDVICKAGQLGFTSIIMAKFLKDCINIPGTTSIVVAHEEFITQRLLAKARFFESVIPAELKPVMHHNSRYELSWDDINSTFYIGSARSYVFGRGERIDNFLASEIAFWDSPEKIMKPVLERARRVIMESTPFGEGTYYHETFKEAEAGDSIWKAHFYPWWMEPNYRIYPDSLDALVADRCTPLKNLTDIELSLMEKHGLDEDQIRWRRRKIVELKEDFFQENPEDSTSCFFASSEMVLDKDILNKMLQGCYPHETTYEGAEVWHLPEADGKYIVGVDPTVGVADKAAIVVWSVHTPKFMHCATYNALLEPEPLAYKARKIAEYYNNAFMVPEANIQTFLAYIKDYPYLYRRRDIISSRESMTQLGWLTTPSTKPFMISVFKALMGDTPEARAAEKEPDFITHDARLIKQARNLRYAGSLIESIGEDDILMAAMIALAARDTAPSFKKGLVGVAGWSDSWGRR